MIRSVVKQCAFSLVNSRAGSSLLGSLEWGDKQPNLLRVLTYHRVDPPEEHTDLYNGIHSATPEQFAEQLDFLTARFHLVSLDEVIAAAAGGAPLPPRAVLLTFDDAYQGFFDHAWPVLQRHQAPVVLFVPTGFPDEPTQTFWWDRVHWAIHSTRQTTVDYGSGPVELRSPTERRVVAMKTMAAIKSMPHRQAMELAERICSDLQVTEFRHCVLSWQRLRELAANGVTMGAHTHTHPLLNQLTLEEARAEATRSRRELEERIDAPVRSFAYPAGGFTANLAKMLREEGFLLAFTTERGINDLKKSDPWQLKRINVGGRSSENVLRLQMLSYARFVR